MFRTANDSISGFTDTVTSFIRTCTEEVVPTKTIKTKTNQKPWINCDVRAALNARNTAFTSGSPDDYKHSRYSLRTVIKQAKRDYRQRVESKLTSNNPRHLWQALQTMTDFKGPRQQITDTAPNLPDKLNHFYARFDSSVRPCVMSCPTPTPADNQNPPLQPLPSNTDNPLPSTTTSAENLDCPPPPHPSPMTVAEQDRPLSITEADVRRTLLRINPRKAAGPDGIPGRVLKSCAHQLAGVFTTIFNLSLSLRTVPTCFKSTTIIPIPKQQKVTSLNDWRPIALTPIISKCFEKLVKSLICPMLPLTLDPLQFAYRPNRGTEDAIAHVLHTALSHLEGRDTYVRMLFVDYSSAFNTIVPSTSIRT
ncbi:uncharacterized protein LOC141773472 [Sebastes fasciatus]|uniref:uncharacterized protein LOC141773472 n=1 Tax=Sebastes fasciatus TaxID=394691 RepID=UPI003D9E9FB9